MKVKVTCGRTEWRVGSLTPVRPKSNASISLSGVGLTTAVAAEGFTPPTFKTTGSAILPNDRLFSVAFITFILPTIIIAVLHFKYCAESTHLFSNVRLPKFEQVNTNSTLAHVFSSHEFSGHYGPWRIIFMKTLYLLFFVPHYLNTFNCFLVSLHDWIISFPSSLCRYVRYVRSVRQHFVARAVWPSDYFNFSIIPYLV